MHVLKFPYVELYTEPSEASPTRKTTLRPIIPVNLIYGRNQILTSCLIDSGSNFCLFDSALAQSLGISVRKGKKEPMTGIIKGRKVAYMHEINLQIAQIVISAYAGFCYGLGHLPFGILGQEGFFSFFKVAFDLPDRSFQLKVRK